MKKVVVAVILIVGMGVAGLWWGRSLVDQPYQGYAGDEVFVEIPPGAGVAAIASRLSAAGVVRHPLLFRAAVGVAGADRRLQAGEYRFTGAVAPSAVVDTLIRGDVYTRAVTFREGLTLWEMADVFAASGLGTAEAFVEAANDVSRVASVDPGASSLEGYLFPDTYHLPRSIGAKGAVDAMVAGFFRAFDGQVRAGAEARGLSVREVVTIASLIEKETGSAPERPIISAVYQNRLRIGMALQCDPTVIYALILAGQWHGNLTRENLRVDSPYNTYRYPGLPPGPIASPGRASLLAAVQPADVKFLYFVSKNDGTHVFASTLAEHNRNVREWQIKYFQNRPR